MPKINFNIQGTHCVACKTLIESEVDAMKGIRKIKVNHRSGETMVDYDSDIIGKAKIKEVINGLNYKTDLESGQKHPQNKKTTNYKQWALSFLILVGLYFVYRIFNQAGLIPEFDIDQSLSFGVAILIGLVASVSTCLMVVGAVIISFSAKYESQGNFYQRSVKPHLLFHFGRLSSFFLLGGLLGLIGKAVDVSSLGISWFTMIIALILIWLALDIMGIMPPVHLMRGGMNKKIGRKWKKLKESNHPLAPISLGALSFFLPCGFTQSMQVFAIGTGSFWGGGIIMLMFALGTFPVLMGLGIASNRFKNMKARLFKKVAGLAILFFALYTLGSGLAIQGITLNLGSNKEVSTQSQNQNEQIINMVADYSGYNPSTFKLQRGVPVKWQIDAQQLSGCNSTIISPAFDIKKTLSTGLNVIEFTPTKTGTFSFSCWMGMIRGKFVVVDEAPQQSNSQSNDVDPSTICTKPESC